MWINLKNMKYASHKKTFQRLHSKATGIACVRFLVGRGYLPREATDAERTVAFSEGYYPVCHQLYKGVEGQGHGSSCALGPTNSTVWKSTSPAAFSWFPVFLTLAGPLGPGCWSGLGPLEAGLEPTLQSSQSFPKCTCGMKSSLSF